VLTVSDSKGNTYNKDVTTRGFPFHKFVTIASSPITDAARRDDGRHHGDRQPPMMFGVFVCRRRDGILGDHREPSRQDEERNRLLDDSELVLDHDDRRGRRAASSASSDRPPAEAVVTQGAG
jgi:hypothetical protein